MARVRMSLVKQLWVAIALLVLLAFGGSMLVSVLSARQYLAQQLQLKNLDNATALALALSQLSKDPATVELQLSAQFDTGHYRYIRLVGPDGKVIVERVSQAEPEDVPAWFIRLTSISAQPGQAQVQDGWNQFGTVMLASHEQYAYRSLWSGVLEMLAWFLAGGVATAAAAALFVRSIRRPLGQVVEQANAVADRRFLTIAEPATPELASVTRAMNAMVGRVRVMFAEEAARLEALRQKVNFDALTGLSAREHFMSELRQLMQDETAGAQGVLVVVRLPELTEINRQMGRPQTDMLLRDLAGELRRHLESGVCRQAGRLSGSEFGLVGGIGQAGEASSADSLVRTVHQGIVEIVLPKWSDRVPDLVSVAAVGFARGEQVASLMSRANEALARAALVGPNGMYAVELEAARTAVPTERWRSLLAEAVEGDGRLVLTFYPVVSRDGLEPVHREGMIRLRMDEETAPLPAGDFMPMAAQLNLTGPIDLRVVRMALEQLRAGTGDIAVNLSAPTIADFGFRNQLTDLLRNYPDVCRRLLFEVPEYGVFQHLEAFRELARTLKGLGARVGIEYLGPRFAQTDRLADLGLDYIKVHPSYLDGIAENEGNQEFLRGVCRMAHSIGIQVFALGVKRREDLPLLGSIGFDGATGPGVG